MTLIKGWYAGWKKSFPEEETMGSEGHDRLNASAPGTVHEKCIHNCADVGVEKSFAQRRRIWYANADILHQSSGPRP
jgi:hypothetical protein